MSPRRINLKTEAAGTPETSGYTAPTSQKTGSPNSHRRVNLRLQRLKNCPLRRHRRQTQRIDVWPSGLLNCCAALGKSSDSQVCYSARIADNIPARVHLEHRLLAYSFGVLTSRDEYQLAAKKCAPLGCCLTDVSGQSIGPILRAQESNSSVQRTALFWAITQRVVVIYHRRFGTIYQSHPRG